MAEPNTNPNKIYLQVVSDEGTQYILVKLRVTMRKIKETYARSVEENPAVFNVFINGIQVTEDQTVASLDLENDHIVELRRVIPVDFDFDF